MGQLIMVFQLLLAAGFGIYWFRTDHWKSELSFFVLSCPFLE